MFLLNKNTVLKFLLCSSRKKEKNKEISIFKISLCNKFKRELKFFWKRMLIFFFFEILMTDILVAGWNFGNMFDKNKNKNKKT